MYVYRRGLQTTTKALIASAGNWLRMARALENGASLIMNDRCAFVNAETIRVYSTSGKTYLTSLSDCVNEETGERCGGFAVGVPCKHRAALHILRKLNEDGEQECEECGARFNIECLMRIDRNLLQPGAVVPSGKCPLCDSYCYPREQEEAIH